MEQRSIILAAVVLALLVSGFGFSRFIPSRDLADQLSTSVANNDVLDNMNEPEVIIDSSDKEDGTELIAVETDPSVAGSIDEEVDTLPAQDNESVPVTAETGASEIALLAAIFAILVGLAGIFRLSRDY